MHASNGGPSNPGIVNTIYPLFKFIHSDFEYFFEDETVLLIDEENSDLEGSADHEETPN
jgi:hypothetical protein